MEPGQCLHPAAGAAAPCHGEPVLAAPVLAAPVLAVPVPAAGQGVLSISSAPGLGLVPQTPVVPLRAAGLRPGTARGACPCRACSLHVWSGTKCHGPSQLERGGFVKSGENGFLRDGGLLAPRSAKSGSVVVGDLWFRVD